jgi:uncharacterized protein (TIGR02466 family)
MTKPGQTHYTHIFGSPLMVHRWADTTSLNEALRVAILDHERANKGAAKTNVGGWHSEFGSLEFCGAEGKVLTQRMREMGDEATARVYREYGKPPGRMTWTLHAWANVNRSGHFNQTHTHAGSTWSGTYYVDAGYGDSDPSQATALHLFDPCMARSDVFLPGVAPSSFSIRPEPGLMVLFPSYIAHMVFPHAGEMPRISIAFNLRREPFP